jgi:hypothetical protein
MRVLRIDKGKEHLGKEWFHTEGQVELSEIVPSWNERLNVGEVEMILVSNDFVVFRTKECSRIERPLPEGTVWTWREQKQP